MSDRCGTCGRPVGDEEYVVNWGSCASCWDARLAELHTSSDEAKAYAFRSAAKINREMADTIGARPGSSIWAALEACAERMDEIADALLSAQRIEAGTAVTPQAVPCAAQEPGPQDAPTLNQHITKGITDG